MLLTGFKVGGFKVFGDPVELNMTPRTKNMQFLSENIIYSQNKKNKVLKSAIIYGGNNTGKSTLLQGLSTFKDIFHKGTLENFPLDIFKNFCFNYDDTMRFEVSFTDFLYSYVYGIEFLTTDTIGEYLFQDDKLLFSRDLDSNYEGILLDDNDFSMRLTDLPNDKLVIPYFNEYTKIAEKYSSFKKVLSFFNKIKFIENKKTEINYPLFNKFVEDENKMAILNKIISSTELYMEKRTVLTEEEIYGSDFYKSIIEINDNRMSNTDDKKDSIKKILEVIRVVSLYKDKNGNLIKKPSFIFDSVGTNKFITLAMNIIVALLDNEILLIDEFDSSLHHKLTRALMILMNSEINHKAQFIITSHDAKLLSPQLFRKDQVHFVVRDNCSVELISLDDYKANSDRDIRSSSNFEKMYIEEKIVPLPDTSITDVIDEIKLYKNQLRKE
jgi:hypothetical protein